MAYAQKEGSWLTMQVTELVGGASSSKCASMASARDTVSGEAGTGMAGCKHESWRECESAKVRCGERMWLTVPGGGSYTDSPVLLLKLYLCTHRPTQVQIHQGCGCVCELIECEDDDVTSRHEVLSKGQTRRVASKKIRLSA
jgi:hypothetical protein